MYIGIPIHPMMDWKVAQDESTQLIMSEEIPLMWIRPIGDKARSFTFKLGITHYECALLLQLIVLIYSILQATSTRRNSGEISDRANTG